MIFDKDHEILELKKSAGLTYRECGNALNLRPTACSQRVLGFLRWLPGERERLVKFLRNRIAERENTPLRIKG